MSAHVSPIKLLNGQQLKLYSAGDAQNYDINASSTGVTITGTTALTKVVLTGSGNVLDLKAGASADHVYLSFFADSQNQATRSGFFGYGTAADPTLFISNEMSNGNIQLGTIGTGKVTVNGQLQSTVASGTPPLIVASPTLIPNLNSDFVDGYQPSFNATANTIAMRGSAGEVLATRFTSNIATGTAPLTVTSTTKVPNLNVESVDGFHMDQDVIIGASPVFTAVTMNAVHVKSSATAERFKIEYNETEGSLDFVYSAT